VGLELMDLSGTNSGLELMDLSRTNSGLELMDLSRTNRGVRVDGQTVGLELMDKQWG
jgi:hypothetical protein